MVLSICVRAMLLLETRSAALRREADQLPRLVLVGHAVDTWPQLIVYCCYIDSSVPVPISLITGA